MAIRQLSQKMVSGELPASDWIEHLYNMQRAHEVARKGYIMYLKHSGERITDLRTLPLDELREWYDSVRDANEREAKRRKDAIQAMQRKRGRG